MICLGKAIEDISIFDNYLDIAQELEEVIRFHGKTLTPDGLRPTWPCWMVWPRVGHISHALNLLSHPILSNFINEMAPIFQPYIPKHLPIELTNFNLVRTKGDLIGHTDELRQCAIHIGLRNSSKSITRFTINDQQFDYRMKEGYAYVFNSQAYHQVISANTDARFFMSYKIVGMSFDNFDEYAKQNNMVHSE